MLQVVVEEEHNMVLECTPVVVLAHKQLLVLLGRIMLPPQHCRELLLCCH